MEDLEKEFQTCVFRIKSRDTMPSDEDLLILYGLYKQATQGDCNIPQPWRVQVEARARWDAWFKNCGMYRDTAMKKYIEKVNELMDGK
jgi:diazepam-binding inhibitor (GABA receptor modulating acyl-CoA-binding protein)